MNMDGPCERLAEAYRAAIRSYYAAPKGGDQSAMRRMEEAEAALAARCRSGMAYRIARECEREFVAREGAGS